MKEKTQVNPYMILSIVFMLAIIVLGTMLYANQYYDFGNGFKIKKSTLNGLSEAMNDNPFRLCDTSNQNNCLIIARIK